jgi:hypothetical protein
MAAGIDLLKGATAAAVDSSHVSIQADANDGLQKVLSTGTAFPLDEFIVQAELDDISTASTAWAVAPHAGVLQRVYTVLHGAISGADSVITASFGGTTVDGLSITVAQSGSAAGDVDTDTPTAAHASTDVAAGDKIGFITSGASTDTARLTGVFIFKRTAL